MTGANYDIIAHGKIDIHLTGNPKMTFWRSTWKTHTKFAIESLSQPFNTSTNFGQESQILINRVGDMVYYMYVHVTLPGIVACDSQTTNCAGIASSGQFPVFSDGAGGCNPCSANDEAALLDYLPAGYDSMSASEKQVAMSEAKDIWRREKYGAGRELGCCAEGTSDCLTEDCPELGDTWAHYVNDVGHFLLNKAKLVIGGQMVETLWSTFLFCWEELTGKSGRRLTELTGRRYTRTQLICDSREERDLYIPLPFYFTLNSGSALPLAALSYHGVQVNITFENLEKLIVISGSHVVVRNARTSLGVTSDHLRAQLEITYVFLDSSERQKFTDSHFEQLICQTQAYFHTDNKQTCRIPLSFNHPCKEIMFGVRRQCQEKANNWSNFSGVDGRDPIVSAELLLNTISRFGKKPALYWRAVVPYQHHTNIPDSFIYVMSFALMPESSLEPSGSCNLSRIDNIELVMEMQSALVNENYTVFIFARSWNIMRYKEGVAGAAFQ